MGLLDLRFRAPAYHISQSFHPVSQGIVLRLVWAPLHSKKKELLLAVKSVPVWGPTQVHIMSGNLWPQAQPCPFAESARPGSGLGAPPTPT